MPSIEIRRRIQNEIKLLEDMLFCFTSQKVINKLIARRDELEEMLGLYRKTNNLGVIN